jgi:uncharacterized protein (UPF0335 family)
MVALAEKWRGIFIDQLEKMVERIERVVKKDVQ